MFNATVLTADSEPQGAAHLVLADGVALLDPHQSTWEAMLEGWERQQRVRFLKSTTIQKRRRLVTRLVEFSNLYPWQWTAAEVEAFIDSLRSEPHRLAVSTARNYTVELRLFLEYLTDPRYGWVQVCKEKFGSAPEQVLDEWNTVVHVTEFEGSPGRRPLSYDEVQRLFDATDDLVDRAKAKHREGVLVAYRNAAILKTVYAFGLRRQEAWGLDVTDLRRNPKIPAYGSAGAVMVRWGKSSRGSAPKRRTVLLVPEMDWWVPVIEQWLTELRPRLGPAAHPALWITERRGRLDWRGINAAFVEARDLAGLDPALDLHSLRHSYVTHLVEFDYPERFVQEQVGHAYASTTSIYTSVSDAYRNTLLRRSLAARNPELWEQS